MTTAVRNDGEAAPCSTCGNSFTWHEENRPMHPFNDGSSGASAFLGPRRADRGRRDGDNGAQRVSQAPPRPAWPIDPVLRQALVDKGILTPEDLRNAEAKIKEMTDLFGMGQSRG